MRIDDLYIVNSIEDIEGNELAISAIKKFITKFKKGEREKPLMVYGPTGIGKTASILKIAEEESLNIIELNASDYRNSTTMDSIIRPALNSKSLFGKSNIIVFDEIDELSGRYDKGASVTILSIIKESKIPIIFIANNMWNQSITFLRNRTLPVEFKKPPEFTLISILKRISNRHRLNISDSTISWIAKMCSGDIRSAINDLYVMWGVDDKDVEVLGLRNKRSNIFITLDRIFMARTLTSPMIAAMYSDVDSNMLINWIDENIPNRYSDLESRYNAFKSLSLASKFSYRASKSGYYTYWKYMSVFLSGGVALSKTGSYNLNSRYMFPRRIKELSASKTDRSVMRSISDKMKRSVHSSISTIMHSELPIMYKILKSSLSKGVDKEDVYTFFMKKFGLEKKEIDWICNHDLRLSS